MSKREKKTKPGEFKKAREKAKKRQVFFDKMKRLREGEEIWVTMRDHYDQLRRMRVRPFDAGKSAGLLLIKARNKFVLVWGEPKDGLWSAAGNREFIRTGEIQEFLGVVVETKGRNEQTKNQTN